MAQTKKQVGQRGKAQEKEVHDFLAAANNRIHKFDWTRLPDPRSSMGRIAAQVADFDFYKPEIHGVIEVKCTEHESRIAKDKLAQLPRLLKRANAGGAVIILIYHSTLDKWRLPPLQVFTPGLPSWDLSQWELWDSAEEALMGTGFFD